MNQAEIAKIKERTEKVLKAVDLIFVFGTILFLVALATAIIAFFAPQYSFKAVKVNMDWYISYKHWGVTIPFNIMHLNLWGKFSAKNAFLTYLISSIIFKMLIILYAIKQIESILSSIAGDTTPFIIENVKRLQKLAYSIIFYSFASDILLSILGRIFVTKILAISLSNTNIIGLLVGGLILVIADIFKYGTFLQNEFDATL